MSITVVFSRVLKLAVLAFKSLVLVRPFMSNTRGCVTETFVAIRISATRIWFFMRVCPKVFVKIATSFNLFPAFIALEILYSSFGNNCVLICSFLQQICKSYIKLCYWAMALCDCPPSPSFLVSRSTRNSCCSIF